MAKNFLSRSCYNALSNLQLQSRLPEHRSAASLKALLQERRTTSTNVRAALTMGTIPRYSERARFLRFLL